MKCMTMAQDTDRIQLRGRLPTYTDMEKFDYIIFLVHCRLYEQERSEETETETGGFCLNTLPNNI